MTSPIIANKDPVFPENLTFSMNFSGSDTCKTVALALETAVLHSSVCVFWGIAHQYVRAQNQNL